MNEINGKKSRWAACNRLRRPGIYATTLLIAVLIVAALLFSARPTRSPAVAINNPPELYGTTKTDQLYAPFHLHIDPMERLLLINFEQDPDEIYVGFEPQVFDDAVHGQGLLVIGWRVDGRVDVYHQPSLTLDPNTYDIAGAGLAEMVERPLSGARFAIKAEGVDAYFAFDDALGRPIVVTIQESSRRARKPFGLLAPMGGAATAPSALPLVLLHDFYFVRRANTTISILVDGKERQPDTLPLPIDGMRMYFTRYSPDVLIATLNPAHQGALMAPVRVSATEARADELIFDLVENHGQTEIAQMRRAFKDRTLTVAFTPSVPNVLNLIDGAQTRGLFTISADPSVGIVTGEYQIRRQGDQVEMQMMPGNWQPNEHKWSLRLLYWLAADFTQWPRTYLWTAVLDLADPQQVSMQASWQRIK